MIGSHITAAEQEAYAKRREPRMKSREEFDNASGVIIAEFPGTIADPRQIPLRVATEVMKLMTEVEVIKVLNTPTGGAIAFRADDSVFNIFADNKWWRLAFVMSEVDIIFHYLDTDKQLYRMNIGCTINAGCTINEMTSLGYVDYCRNPEIRDWRYKDKDGNHWEVSK